MSLPVFNLSNLDGSNGFRIDSLSSFSIGDAGDVNGDGFGDVILGDYQGSANAHNAGASYVVFGRASGFDAQVDLETLDGSNGFRLDGEQGDFTGRSVSSAGDINGDGLDDVIVSGLYSSYVVFGKIAGFEAQMNLSELDGTNGFRLDDWSSVISAGDVNGDGVDDVIVYGLDGLYVLFGQASGFDAVIDVSGPGDGSSFHQITDSLTWSTKVSEAGDINGDGFNDLILGDKFAVTGGNYTSGYYSYGASYIVFGRASGMEFKLDGSSGFSMGMYGEGLYNSLGASISSAGDVNGDGFDDVIIGDSRETYSYVVFGKASGFSAKLDLATLDGDNGFVLIGGYGNPLETSVSGAGDVNGDGFDDLIVGAQLARPNLSYGAGYVIFGKASGFDARINLTDLGQQDGFRLEGDERLGKFVSGAGDVNGDGFADVMIQAADPSDVQSSYIIFGSPDVVGGGLPVISGTSGDDRLEGTPAAEHFDAGEGNDSLLGGGGADRFVAGAGDDSIAVPDLGFALIEGGAGRDTLQLLGDNLNLDLTQADNITGIEGVGLGTGGSKLEVTSDTLRHLVETGFSGLNDIFAIEGDSSAQVTVLDDGWYDLGRSSTGHNYLHNGMLLRVDNAVQVDFAAGISAVFDLASLNGHNGFRLDGENIDDGSGWSVSSAGDVNGDGYDDVVIGTNFHFSVFPDNEYELSSSYVVFGKAGGFDPQMKLSELDGSNGFRLDRPATRDSARFSVSEAGDVNGDGFDDVILGTTTAQPNGIASGSSWVIFGKASGFDAHIDVSGLDGSNGFRLDGEKEFDLLGSSIGSAGDINGDGFEDVLVRADGINPDGVFGEGTTFVIFGKASGFDAQVDLSSLNGSNGFLLDGGNLNDDSAFVINSAGDVNGDGFDDLIIGSARANIINPDFYGSNYVVFGKASGFDAQLDLSNLDGSNGFRVDGENSDDTYAYSVSSAGDMNGDGFDDVVIGANRVDSQGQSRDTNYVIFGKASGFDAHIDLSGLDGSNGFRLDGNVNLGYSNFSASSAGDVNGDGFDDLILGDSTGFTVGTFSGPSYLIFGKASGFDAQVDVTSLDDNSVLRLMGNVDRVDSNFVDIDPFVISAAGDVNGDGFDDLIVGDSFASFNGTFSGSSYVIFGNSDFGNGGGGELPEIPGTAGDDVLRGTSLAEQFEAGDGNDILIGGGGADVFRGSAGVDQIKIPDLNFASIDGGVGDDILHLAGGDLNLDLTAAGDNIQGIETICLYGRGDNSLALTAGSVLDLSDTSNTLKLHGNAGDRLTVQDDGWVDEGLRGGGYYHVYTNDEAVLLVGMNVTIDFA